MKKYIFKDDGINGIKVQSYDYEVVEGKERQTSKPHTIRLYPDADLTEEAQEIKDCAKKCFTAKVKKAYKVKKKAEKVEADKTQAKEDKKPKPFTGEKVINFTTYRFINGLLVQ